MTARDDRYSPESRPAPALQIISEFPNYLLTPDPNQPYSDLVPPPYEGRFAIVTDVRRDAVDAEALLTNGADADGENVWS
jgi:hypothetical protein